EPAEAHHDAGDAQHDVAVLAPGSGGHVARLRRRTGAGATAGNDTGGDTGGDTADASSARASYSSCCARARRWARRRWPSTATSPAPVRMRARPPRPDPSRVE